MSRITCPKCHYENHPSRRQCLCGYPLDEMRQKEFEKLQAEMLRKLNSDLAETPAAQAPPPGETFPSVSADSPKQVQFPPETAPVESEEMQKQAIRQALLIESSNYENSAGKSKINWKISFIGATLVIAIAAVLAVLASFSDLFLNSEEARDEQQQRASSSPLLTDPNIAPASQNPAANIPVGKNSVEGEVVDVGSGDTITVAGNNNEEYQIKLEGIDAPEMEQQFGREAQENLFALVFGKTVQANLQKTDADGIVVGKVLADGKNVSLEQLKAGLAWHDKNAVLNESEKDIYADNETIAKRDGYGLWAEANPLPPWEFRNSYANRDEKNRQTAASDKNGDNPKAVTNVPSKAKTDVQETVNANQSQTTSTETSAAPGYTKSLPADGNQQQPPLPKISTPVPDGYERKTTIISRTPTARCGDGTLSFSATRSGSCAGHGGVAEWLTKPPAPAKPDTPEKNYVRGLQGGCYFVNKNGKKVYVDRDLCNK